jgi:serine/threonine protein kinase
MGVVFEGVADGGEPVAIKVVTTELSQDEVFVRRFQREVAAAQKISHPHVVPVLGAGEEGGLPYLVQALIAGGSLHDRLVKDGTLDLATTIRMLRGPAEGIDALHASGLVHRDIKPGNILLDGETAYVTDFGLAKDSQASNLTRPGQALGCQRGDRYLRPRLHDPRMFDRHAALRRPAQHARALRASAGGSPGSLRGQDRSGGRQGDQPGDGEGGGGPPRLRRRLHHLDRQSRRALKSPAGP